MNYFEPNEMYVLYYDVLAVVQGCLLAYLLGIRSNNPIKYWLNRVVFAYFLFSLAAVPIGRIMYQLAEPGVYDDLRTLPAYQGVEYLTWMGIMTALLFGFLLVSIQLWYALLNRQRDMTMLLVSIPIVGAMIWALFFPEHMYGNDTNRAIMLMGIYLPGTFFGIFIMGRGLFRLEDGVAKKRLRVFFYAYLLPTLAIFVNGVLVTKNLITMTESNLIVGTIAVGRAVLFIAAITVYGVFRMELDYASEDIFENMDDPVLLLDPNEQIIRANLSAQKYLGIAVGASSHVDGTQFPKIRELLPDYNRNKTRFDVRFEMKNQTKEYNCAQTLVVRKEMLVGSVLLFRDVTREKELARMKTDFTSTVSHELRTPLTSVLGFAKLIQKRFHEVVLANYQPSRKKEDKAVAQISNNLDVIISEGTRLTSLINDVLDISKIEAGRIEWNFLATDLRSVIAKVDEETAGLFADTAVQLIYDIPKSVPEVVVDPNRIAQVLVNLLTNAAKFTHEGCVTIKLEVQPSQLLVHVIDTGMGISKADQESVFEMYKQAGNVITDKPQGAGLGLPISKKIIEQHGGSIGLQSTLGEGTTVSFALPFANLTQQLPVPSSFDELCLQTKRLVSAPNQGSAKILLIDDEESIRKVLRNSFESAGYHVIEANNGQHGIALAQEHSPDVVILDVFMPVVNGFEVAVQLSKERETMAIPIMMLTVIDDVQRMYGLGIEHYMTKPFVPEDIVKEAQKMLTNRAKSRAVIVLGDIGQRLSILRKRVQQWDCTVYALTDSASLQQAIHEHKPILLIVSETEVQSPEQQATVVQALRHASIRTCVLRAG